MPEVLSRTQAPSFRAPVSRSRAVCRDRVSRSPPRWTVSSAWIRSCRSFDSPAAPDTGWPSTANMASPFLSPAAEAGDRAPSAVSTAVRPTTWTPLVYRTTPTACPPSRTVGRLGAVWTVLRGTRPRRA